MNPEAIQKIIDALEKNGGSALEAMAAYQVASAYGDLILTILAPLVTFGAIYYLRKSMQVAEDSPFDSAKEKAGIVGAIAFGLIAVLMGITSFVGVISIPNTIAAIKNPKGAAIHNLLKKG